MTTAFEYHRIIVDVHDIAQPTFEAKLSALGASGWEMCASFTREHEGSSKEVYFVFKRPRA